MAEYCYRCQGCQHVFRAAHSVYQTALVLCPLCEDKAPRILDGVPLIVTKEKVKRLNVQGSSTGVDSKGDNAINTAQEDADSKSPEKRHGCGCAWNTCFHTVSLDTTHYDTI